MKYVVAAFFLACFGLSVCAQDTPHYARDLMKGTGYQVALPPDVVVNLEVNDESSHGFVLDLLRPGDARPWGGTPSRYIAFNARFDTDELGSLDAVVRKLTRHIEDLIPLELQGSGMLTLSGTFPTKLGDLPARRLVLEFKNSDKQLAIRQLFVAYRSRPDASGLIYMAILNTTRADFQQDLKMFSRILAGFQITSVD